VPLRHHGDGGLASLFDGTRIPKTDVRFSALGDVDELASMVGLTLTWLAGTREHERLVWVQERLFRMGADLANPGRRARGDEIAGADLEVLDAWLLEYRAALPPLQHFVMPGGTPAAAGVHLCRAVCRRAERSVFAVRALHPVHEPVPVFLNRLSDVLFEMARFINTQSNVADTEWLGPRDRKPSGPAA